MKRYKVEMQREGSVKYFFIRDMETLEIVLLPSKYLMHQVRANRSPNTIRRNAFALAYYWEYLLEEEHEAEDVYGMDYETQYDFFAEYLKWLKAGKHTDNLDKEPQNKTCNAYLKEVFRFYSFLEVVRNNGSCLSVLSYNQPITKANAIGVRRTIRSRSFKGYLKEEERNVRAAERNEIVTILEACTNCRDQVLILLTSELGFRIGDDDDKIRLNQRKPSKYKGLSRFGPEKNLQRINKFMKERPIFYKNLIQMKENFRFYLRCFYCITKVVILQFNSENRTELARNG